MKRIAAVVFLSTFFITGCLSMGERPKPTATYTITPKDKTDFIVGIANIDWGGNLYSFEIDGIKTLYLSFNNTTDGIVKINWSNSSIFYDGKSHVPFLEGMKYINAGSPPPSTVVPGKTNMSMAIFSSAQPYYVSGQYGYWFMRPMAMDIKAIICAEISGEERYYTVDISSAL